MNIRERDKTFLARDSPAEELQVVKSDGDFLFDRRGRKYIDFLMAGMSGISAEGIRKSKPLSGGPRALNIDQNVARKGLDILERCL